jgi:hypothetical protein
MIQCMMIQCNMAPEWWGEAAKTAVATTNALPFLLKSKSSPSQLFLKLLPRPEFFKPFGCKAWVLKPKQKRDAKFDAVAWEGMLVGYENDYLCYHIYNHKDGKFEYSREFQFNEQAFPHCQAIHKSLEVRLSGSMDIPVFASKPILPFDDTPVVEDSPPNN